MAELSQKDQLALHEFSVRYRAALAKQHRRRSRALTPCATPCGSNTSRSRTPSAARPLSHRNHAGTRSRKNGIKTVSHMSSDAGKKAKELARLLAFQNACPDCRAPTLTQPEPPAPDGFPPIQTGNRNHGVFTRTRKKRLVATAAGNSASANRSGSAIFIRSKTHQALQVSVLWTIFTSCPMVREEKQIAQEIARHVFENTSIQLQNCQVFGMMSTIHFLRNME